MTRDKHFLLIMTRDKNFSLIMTRDKNFSLIMTRDKNFLHATKDLELVFNSHAIKTTK